MITLNDQNRTQREDLPDEIWKDVPEYEGYAISNYGRVKSKERMIQCSNNRSYIVEERILSPHVGGKGYAYVTLNKNSHKKSFLVHRLVAELFIPNPDNLPNVDHIDTDP